MLCACVMLVVQSTHAESELKGSGCVCRPQWRSKCAAPPAVMQYLAYLETIARDEPALLIAHLYTQHSAILAGGQMIR